MELTSMISSLMSSAMEECGAEYQNDHIDFFFVWLNCGLVRGLHIHMVVVNFRAFGGL